jgi:predicted nucleotidyltransferase
MITPTAIEALKLVKATIARLGGKLVLIGAAVPHILALSSKSESGSRETRDIDGVVEAKDWENFNQLREELFSLGFEAGRGPQNFKFRGTEIDLIPFGDQLIVNDQLIWPETQIVMSSIGLQEAFDSAVTKQLTPDFSISVVPIPTLVLLKIISYLDRPDERARDLLDIVFIFDRYEYEEVQDRRFDLTGLIIDGSEITYEETIAYIVGSEIAKIAEPKSRRNIDKFLKLIPDEYARVINQILTEEGRFVETEERRHKLYRFFKIFAAGL